MSPPKKIALGIALAIAVNGALIEVLPRLFEIPGLTREDLQPLAVRLENGRVEPHPYLGYANKPGFRSGPGAAHQIAHNSLGFRGPEISPVKPSGTFRVACLGGSSTYGHGPSADATTWPARLEALLEDARPGREVEVINAGCQGYSTFESLTNYAFRVSPLAPDVVIVYHTINDMRCALYKGGVERDNTHWRAPWLRMLPSQLEGSKLYLFWRRYFTDYYEDLGDFGRFVIVDYDGSLDPYAIRPDTEIGYGNFRRNLDAIVTLAGRDGARVMLGRQACRTSDWQGAPSAAQQLEAFDHMTEIVERVAQEAGLPPCRSPGRPRSGAPGADGGRRH